MSTTSTPVPNRSEMSPLRFLERSANVFPDRAAIVYGERTYTYAEFADETQRLARVLASKIEPGDRVAYLAPNIPEMLIAHFAVPLAGGVLVALNSRLAGAELAYILNHSEATILVADSEFHSTVAAIADVIPSLHTVVEVEDPEFGTPAGVEEIEGLVSYAEFLSGAGDLPARPWTVDDENTVITINYTSGTTGKPKGVMYTHRGAYLNSFGETFHNQFTGHTRYLWTLPMFHCNGWCTPWAVTAASGTHICLRAVRADAIWSAIDDLGATHMCGAPTVCTTIVGAEQAHELDRPLRITTAGAPPSPTVIGQLSAIGITVVHVYGLTEVYGPFTICEYQDAWDDLSADERAKKLSRQGVSMVQAEDVRVIDREQQGLVDVPADGETMGEILLRGNNVMAGYFKDPAATAEAFAGGWFHTGDLGVMHPDGYVQLRDRAKDIIISGGENISTVEVEQALVSHDAVLDVAVVGVPDEKWGERPRAYVLLNPGATLTAEELIAYGRKMLAGYKIPRDIVFPDDLPRTSTGKVMKFELRKQAAQG
ncbi:AMP-binding protein [Gordonia amarae]|uniref:AMP-binding protein n=2 Tax=Gordonia amarae TaxID=36821 RepID=A0A857KX79_9ACTN|nr:AMP-binding protein [Gordonia amarae]MCS3877849.1 fatty-acyl-CoA synthase [Gordonia amarae]QHN16575.1 AMP-binding protein [Gordonia amarae]QHN21100.1 AMP-binding protein [Gordonia amarae]QHN29952.1 AMP-binding protein [Gordonia amarae]QHN38727.1 AMP-binding protein [Gordonia amarae]